MPEMKPVSDVVCLVADYGYFANLAEKLSESFKKQYYYSPVETEFRFVRRSHDWRRAEQRGATG